MKPILLLSLLLLFAACASKPAAKSTVVFLCPHGGAKSVIAASYFNQLASEQGLPFEAVAAATEDPYEAVPPPVATFLETEGFDVRALKPRSVEQDEVAAAAKVVSIGCDLSKAHIDTAHIEQWDDVPLVSNGVAEAAAAIRQHVERLAAALRARR